MSSGWDWEEFFLFYWFMELWDWTFGTSGRSRRSSCRASYRSRRAKRTSGSSGHSRAHDATIGLLADIYAAFIILPFVLLFASAKESKRKRRRQIQSRRSVATTRRKGPNHPPGGGGTSGEKRPTSRKTDSKPGTASYASAASNETQRQQERHKERLEKTREAIRNDKGPDAEWAAEQEDKAAEERRLKIRKQAEERARNAEIRNRAFAGFTLPLTARYTSDEAMLHASRAIEDAEGDRGIYLGLFEVSYLMQGANDTVIYAAVKGDNLSRSLSIRNFPEEVQKPIEEYIAAGGTVQGYTKPSWVDEDRHVLKAVIYLKDSDAGDSTG